MEHSCGKAFKVSRMCLTLFEVSQGELATLVRMGGTGTALLFSGSRGLDRLIGNSRMH